MSNEIERKDSLPVEAPSVVLLNNVNGFRQLVTFIENTLTDTNIRAHVYTKEDESDGLVYWYIDTESGVSSQVDCMLNSKPLDTDVWVYAKDLCVVCDKLANEHVISMWTFDNVLYIGGFFNEKMGGFEAQVGLKSVPKFELFDHFDPFDRFDIDQIAMATISDSIYNFDSVEIWRKNNVVSYRMGNGTVCLATVMQSEMTAGSAGERSRDISVRIPAAIFKSIPVASPDIMCSIELDPVNKYARISNGVMTIQTKYEDGVLETATSSGMEDFCSIDSLAIATTIDMMFGINYTDPTGVAKLYATDDGVLAIEVDNHRANIVLTIGESIMHNTERSVELPMDVLTMMIRNTKCKRLTLKANYDTGAVMMCYNNALYARKCTYLP